MKDNQIGSINWTTMEITPEAVVVTLIVPWNPGNTGELMQRIMASIPTDEAKRALADLNNTFGPLE